MNENLNKHSGVNFAQNLHKKHLKIKKRQFADKSV
jgi:hypothetical protein